MESNNRSSIDTSLVKIPKESEDYLSDHVYKEKNDTKADTRGRKKSKGSISKPVVNTEIKSVGLNEYLSKRHATKKDSKSECQIELFNKKILKDRNSKERRHVSIGSNRSSDQSMSQRSS